jgi:streptogramin lyase
MSWWPTSQVPIYGNVAGGPPGGSAYWGGVYLPDGRVLFVPQGANSVGFFNPATGLFSAALLSVTTGFRGGVLTPSGNVVFVPYSSANALVYNPLSGASANVVVNAPGSSFQGGVLVPSGNVVFFPKSGGSNIGVLNPTNFTYSNTGPVGSFAGGGALLPNGNIVCCSVSTGNIGMYNTSVVGYPLSPGAFTNVGPINNQLETAVLAPNGNVVFFPWSGANAVVYNPSSVVYPVTGPGTYMNVALNCGGSAYEGAALLSSGNIVCAPITSTSNIGMFDTVALTFSNAVPAASGFAGATLLPSGQVVFVPFSSANVGVLDTFTPAPQEFCLSPYFNKF